MVNVTEVVGYTHSDGYVLCPKHADYGDMIDTGNESGKVYPIFAGDEWDYAPTCDVTDCDFEIDVVIIGESDDETFALGNDDDESESDTSDTSDTKKYTYSYQVKYPTGHTTTSELTIESSEPYLEHVQGYAAYSQLEKLYPGTRIVSLVLIKIDEKNVQ